MQPGLELDVVIAQFLGWQDVRIQEVAACSTKRVLGIRPDERPSPYTGYRPSYHVPYYSQNIEAAWQIVIKLGDQFRGLYREDDQWIAVVIVLRKTHVKGSTPAHAICLAALEYERMPHFNRKSLFY